MFSFRNEATTQMTQYTKKNISSHSTAFNLVLEISQKRTENKNYLKPISSFRFLAVATNWESETKKKNISSVLQAHDERFQVSVPTVFFVPNHIRSFVRSSLLNEALRNSYDLEKVSNANCKFGYGKNALPTPIFEI